MTDLTLFALVMGPVAAVCCIVAAYRVGFSWGFSAGTRYGLDRGVTMPRPQKHWDIDPQ